MVNNAGVFLGLNNIVDETTSNFDKTMVSRRISALDVSYSNK